MTSVAPLASLPQSTCSDPHGSGKPGNASNTWESYTEDGVDVLREQPVLGLLHQVRLAGIREIGRQGRVPSEARRNLHSRFVTDPSSSGGRLPIHTTSSISQGRRGMLQPVVERSFVLSGAAGSPDPSAAWRVVGGLGRRSGAVRVFARLFPSRLTWVETGNFLGRLDSPTSICGANDGRPPLSRSFDASMLKLSLPSRDLLRFHPRRLPPTRTFPEAWRVGETQIPPIVLTVRSALSESMRIPFLPSRFHNERLAFHENLISRSIELHRHRSRELSGGGPKPCPKFWVRLSTADSGPACACESSSVLLPLALGPTSTWKRSSRTCSGGSGS